MALVRDTVRGEMEFRLLGPLTVQHAGEAISVPRGKQRVLLAVLLLNANRAVAVDDIAEVLWGYSPPASVYATIQNYVKRLRLALGHVGRMRISTGLRAYTIHVGAGELDVLRFEALARSVNAALKAADWDRAAADARVALALWRGTPLADVESDELATHALPRLEEIRLWVLEAGLEADLHLGGHADAIPELQTLARAHPMREHLHAMLMLALYQSGRQGEALAAYRHARRALIAELGTEPGAELNELHQRILAADPTLSFGGRRRAQAHETHLVTPRELPATAGNFTGRDSELAMLNEMLSNLNERVPGTAAISIIEGTTGVGKTALAIRWAHQIADRFPGGHLHVHLRGCGLSPPLSTTTALAGFLRSLGVADQDVPPNAEERAARYRSMVSGRRILIVLDGASDAEQVRPLLPADDGSMVLVTSRNSLTGLVAREGAQRLHLDVLSPTDALGLLRTLVGRRADVDPVAAIQLAAECCRLPLALQAAAGLAVARPGTSLADLVTELDDQPQKRLDLLDVALDGQTTMRAMFDGSYRWLDGETARAFRLASLHPGPDWDRYALAALIGGTPEKSGEALDILARMNLIRSARQGRDSMHGLLRAYARELADALDGAESQRQALTRLLDYYLHNATAAIRALRHDGDLPEPGAALGHSDRARRWLTTEWACLATIVADITENDWPRRATRLAATLAVCSELLAR
jgi:DNA-binding SARP family transcriptional activator